MLSLIFTIILVPFVPVFMYGNLADTADIISGRDKVLGESKNKDETAQDCDVPEFESKASYSLFPLNYSGGQGFTPIRKPDFYEIRVWAGSSVAIDVDSGTILEYFDGRKRTQIASLTKLMTAVLAVEKIENLNEGVTITREALNVPGTVVGCPTSVLCTSNRMYAGEKITAGDLLKAMLLDSANDAAHALAIHISGSPEKFTAEMNEKAKSLGLKDTNFCTPSGLEIDGQESECYSSAYDIARIAAYSLKHELIWNTMRIEEAQIFSTDQKYMHQLKNTDLLLSEMPDCIGGKTGFTPMAGKSLLLAVSDPTKRHRVIAVILNDEDRWNDMKKLISWVFENYEWR